MTPAFRIKSLHRDAPMSNARRTIPLLLTIASLVVSPAGACPDEPAVKDATQKETAIVAPTPPADLPPGTPIYRTLARREAQVTFTSEAPVERIVGKSNGVLGYAVPGPADAPARLSSAAWILPVNSLATGIPLRDEHMIGSAWLDATRYPAIRFTLERVDDLSLVKRGDGFSTWSGTLVGLLAMHGVERELRVTDAKLSFLAASDRTAAIAQGDLLFIKCDYTIKLSDFGIVHDDVPKKVADEVRLSQIVRMSTSADAPRDGKETSQGGSDKAAAPAK